MNEFYEKAIERLRDDKGLSGNKETAMAPAVREALEKFCEEDGEFAQAVVQGGSFAECMQAVAKAREEEKAAAKEELERLEKKLQKAEKAREQAEATAKAAEDKLETAAADVAKERDGLKLELQEARRKLEMSDVTVAQFKIVFDTVQGNLNDMLALIAKASCENQAKLRAAAEKLVDAFKGRIES